MLFGTSIINVHSYLDYRGLSDTNRLRCQSIFGIQPTWRDRSKTVAKTVEKIWTLEKQNDGFNFLRFDTVWATS